jgi:hypothetical protein
VDPKSGRTYWYHRIKRISTWLKPVFISDQNKLRLNGNDIEDLSLSVDLDFNQAIKENDYLMKTEFRDIRSSNEIKTVDNATHYDDKLQQKQQDEQRLQNDTGQSKNRKLDTLSSDFSTATSISNAVSCLTSSNEYSRIDAMLLLSSRCCIDVETSVQLTQTENLLDNLITIISGGDSKKCRRMSLKILCSLASCDDDNVKHAFYGNQSWVIISGKFEQWNDDEAVLLYCIMVSLLDKGPAQAVMSREMKNRLENWVVESLYSYDIENRKNYFDLMNLRLLSFPTDSSCSSRPDDWGILYSLYLIAEGIGEPDTLSSLSALSLLLILTHSIHSEQIMKLGGGSTCLLGLCTASNINQVVTKDINSSKHQEDLTSNSR